MTHSSNCKRTESLVGGDTHFPLWQSKVAWKSQGELAADDTAATAREQSPWLEETHIFLSDNQRWLGNPRENWLLVTQSSNCKRKSQELTPATWNLPGLKGELAVDNTPTTAREQSPWLEETHIFLSDNQRWLGNPRENGLLVTQSSNCKRKSQELTPAT